MAIPQSHADDLDPVLAAPVAADEFFDLWHHQAFVARTETWFHDERRGARAAGQSIDYRLEDIRHLVRNNVGERHCGYCRGPIRASDFAIVYRVPPERGGGFGFHNLEVMCAACGQAKGSLDRIEFKELFELLRTWSPFVRRYFLARLRSGVGPPHVRFLKPNRVIRAPEEATTLPPREDELPTDD